MAYDGDIATVRADATVTKHQASRVVPTLTFLSLTGLAYYLACRWFHVPPYVRTLIVCMGAPLSISLGKQWSFRDRRDADSL